MNRKTFPITKDVILSFYKALARDTHKGIQGHALIIAGSYGKMGAAVLASKASLKTGCGLVTAFVPKCGYEILQTSIPEVMVLSDIADKYISSILFTIQPQAVGIGPGIGLEPETELAFLEFLKRNTSPLVIDADGLNIISKHIDWLKWVPEKTILTPHQKELERLIGTWNSETERRSKAIAFSLQHQLIIVMKGAPTLLIDGNSIYENTTGNQALATAGSGDVLTGMIISLLAQGYGALEAAQLGVYLHGLTADIAAPKMSYQAFIASDIIDNIGNAYLEMVQ